MPRIPTKDFVKSAESAQITARQVTALTIGARTDQNSERGLRQSSRCRENSQKDFVKSAESAQFASRQFSALTIGRRTDQTSERGLRQSSGCREYSQKTL